MTVRFSSKDEMKVFPGDYITLTLPDNLSAFYRENPVEIYMNGQVIGHAIVESNNLKKVTVVFSEIIENYQFITGGLLEMDVRTAPLPVHPDNIYYSMDFTTNLGTDAPEASYTIYRNPHGTVAPLFTKVGDIASSNAEVIRWFIRVNDNHSGLESDVVVHDILGEGQYRPDDFLSGSFFRIWIMNDDGDIVTQPQLSLENAVAQGIVSVNIVNDMEVIFTFHKNSIPDNMRFELNYRTRITDEGKYFPEIENTAVANYTKDGQEIQDTQTSKVKPPFSVLHPKS